MKIKMESLYSNHQLVAIIPAFRYFTNLIRKNSLPKFLNTTSSNVLVCELVATNKNWKIYLWSTENKFYTFDNSPFIQITEDMLVFKQMG